MRSQDVKKYIEDRGYLFWYTPAPKGENVTDNLLVETVLNYGSIDDVRELFRIVGLKNVAKIFFDFTGQSERHKGNYFPEIHNYFDLYFKKHAS
jgi:hypothetical protein